MTELDRAGGTRFNLPAFAPGKRLEDSLAAAVGEAAAPDYEVLGEVARGSGDQAVLFLAREIATRALVALRATAGAGPHEYLLEIARKLDPSLPAPDSSCHRCGAPFKAWGRFCGQCGAAVWGDVIGGNASPADLRAAVEEAGRGRYEVLGEMARGDGPGVVYFARDLESGRIEALRVQPEGANEYSIGKTSVLRRLSVSVTAPRAASPERPARVPPPPVVPPSRPVAPAPPTPSRPPPRRHLAPEPAPKPRGRRSLHISIPDIELPDLPPVVWVAIAAVALAVLLVVLLA
jgi:hypothetical protein